MATITWPGNSAIESMRPVYRRSSQLAMSPYNFTQQVYRNPGKMKVVEVTIAARTEAQFDTWSQWLDDMDGHTNTSNVDLSTAYPHETGITSVAMRLVNPDVEWTVANDGYYELSFALMEAL